MSDLLDRASEDAAFAAQLDEALSCFRCAQDTDIEDFLHHKAKEHLSRGLCSIYLVLSEDAFLRGQLHIEAYFTLSHKSLITGNAAASKSKIQKYAGFKTAQTLDFVLIGQLGKYVALSEDGALHRSMVSGAEVLDYAFEVIRSAASLIPCKVAFVECSNDHHITAFYENYGFTFFQHDGKHNQYCKLI